MVFLRIILLALTGAATISLLSPALIEAPSKARCALGNRVATQFNQRYLTSGLGDLVNEPRQDYLQAYSVSDGRKLTLEQGKRLAADMLKLTLDIALSTPIYEHYLQAVKKDEFYVPGVAPEHMGPEQFGFKVGFWDENVDRPQHPYLAQIRAAVGKVYFYYADPQTHALQEPAAEIISYNDLLEWRRTH